MTHKAGAFACCLGELPKSHAACHYDITAVQLEVGGHFGHGSNFHRESVQSYAESGNNSCPTNVMTPLSEYPTSEEVVSTWRGVGRRKSDELTQL
jgi:hypothetical protein